jgi:hypothetical protein
MADSDQDSVVSDHFYVSSGKLVQPLREWWKVDPSTDIQTYAFKKLSEVDLSVPEPKSGDVIILLSKLDEAGFVVDMVEEEEPKGYWEVGNWLNRQVWKEAGDRELDSVDRART